MSTAESSTCNTNIRKPREGTVLRRPSRDSQSLRLHFLETSQHAYHVPMHGETITIFGSQRKGPREFGPVAGVFVFLPLMAIATLISLPFLPVVAHWEKHKKRLLADVMTRQKRALQWEDFTKALEEKRGTLIVEGDPFKGPNLWWTSDDVRSASPYRCSCDIGTLRDRGYDPFMQWCYERYLSPKIGHAFLVLGGEGQRRGFALGSQEDELAGTGIFKDMPTVLVTGQRHRRQ